MPSTKLRQTVLTSARRIVVKLGTKLLTTPTGALDLAYLKTIAQQIAKLREQQFQVTLVSSGAIGAGCAELGLEKRPRDVADLQAVAAVGQRRLMTLMHEAFAPYRIEVGQVLLTRGDFEQRSRFLNIRNCVLRLHKLGCLPVLNENDSVSVDELCLGDNDMLAALICNALRADALVLLTVVDGLLDDQDNKIDLVSHVADVTAMARPQTNTLGTGGMATKLQAARLATEAGEIAVIANGREPDVLTRLFQAQPIGTVFVPASKKLDSRRRWIGLTKKPQGTVTIDEGAVTALTRRGKSLLASGIVTSTGRFEQGQVVSVCDPDGSEIARGLINYSQDELKMIMGKRSNQFEKILGRRAYAAVIHRDNLMLIRT